MPLLGNRDSILEIIRSHPGRAKKLWVEEGYQNTFGKIIDEAKRHGIPFRTVGREEFERRFKGFKNRLCLESDDFSYADPDEFLVEISSLKTPFLSAFDAINDPQNLAILPGPRPALKSMASSSPRIAPAASRRP